MSETVLVGPSEGPWIAIPAAHNQAADEFTPLPWSVIERPSYFGVYSRNGRLVASCAKPHPYARRNAELIVKSVMNAS